MLRCQTLGDFPLGLGLGTAPESAAPKLRTPAGHRPPALRLDAAVGRPADGLRQPPRALQLAAVLADEDGQGDAGHQHESGDHREEDVGLAWPHAVSAQVPAQEEVIVHLRSLLEVVLHHTLIDHLLHWSVEVRERELHLEGLPLRQAHAEDVLEHEPLEVLVAIRGSEAAIISVEVAIQGGAQGSHEVDGLPRGLVRAIRYDLFAQEELLEEEVLVLADVKHEAQDHQGKGIMGLRRGAHVALPGVHDVQLRSELAAVDHVLGGHVQMELPHVIELREPILADQLDVAQHIAGDLQGVAVVGDAELLHRLPVHPVQKRGASFHLDIARQDVDG
mmetsp:Transcript_76409/g.183014  ORF Transcript_76409/g.183014 Transcript_76409/m.183014 type:complete len:334 (+) Transcript_76409:63-1064(+)